MFIGNGARSASIRSRLAVLTLLALATTAHAQSAIPEDRLPDLCSGAYYNRAAYIVRFDVQTNTFSRPATDPLESEEIVLCMDGTPDPLVTYSIEYAEQSDGTTPTAQTLAVGAAPSRFEDPRATAAAATRTTLKCRTCDALARAHALVDAEVSRVTRILTTLDSSDDSASRHALEMLAERGPCSCARRHGEDDGEPEEDHGAACPQRRPFCDDQSNWQVVAWVNHELRSAHAGFQLVDGRWLALPAEPPIVGDPDEGVDAGTKDKIDSTGLVVSDRTSPLRLAIQPLPAIRAVEFTVEPGSDSVLELYGRESNDTNWTLLASNDDRSASDLGSRVDFVPRDGWSYEVVVSSYWPDRAFSGTLQLTTPRTPLAAPDGADAVAAVEELQRSILTKAQTYDRLRALASNLFAAHSDRRSAYRLGAYPGNRLLVVRAREHRSSLRLSDEGTSLAHTVETTPHSISITIKSTSWFSLNAGMVVSGLPRHTFRARQASETQSVLVRDIADWSVDPVFFATIHWCAQDLSRPIYARRCAGYAPTPRDVVDPGDVPLGNGRFNHLSPEAERLRRRERLRRWSPGFAIGVPLDRKVFDFNLLLGLSLPYIPYVSIITGVQLARVNRVREGIGLAPASGSAGDATTFGVGENAVDAGTHQRLVPGWFIAITLTDEIFRKLFPSLEAASK